jgi:hypothetical protein
VYAWPVEAGATGTTAYFLNQEGDLLETANVDQAYSGESKAPAFDAAFGAHNPRDMAQVGLWMTEKSNDGHAWTLVGM